MQIALANNPDLVAISRQAVAAGYDVRVAAGRPAADLVGRRQRRPTSTPWAAATDISASPIRAPGTQTTAGLNARIPIFQGGLPAARTRQAQAIEGQTLEQVVGTERAVVADHPFGLRDL